MGLIGSESGVAGLVIGHLSPAEARTEVALRLAHLLPETDQAAEEPSEADWNPDLRRQLERYARGEPVDFAECVIDVPATTAFRKRVLESTRRIGYGETATYSELAAKAGSPGAARAVGNVMKSNRIPLIIPCHRIVGAGGPGGYSAPQGLALKQRLLAMEADH
jgi:methylated-DNA-[protein]-cysteine S-methyltransferase